MAWVAAPRLRSAEADAITGQSVAVGHAGRHNYPPRRVGDQVTNGRREAVAHCYSRWPWAAARVFADMVQALPVGVTGPQRADLGDLRGCASG